MDNGFRVGLGILLFTVFLAFAVFPVIRLLEMFYDGCPFWKLTLCSFAVATFFVAAPVLSYFYFFIWV